MIDENAMDVDDDSLGTLLNILFFNAGQKVYIISEIISSNTNYETVWLYLDYAIQFL